jgi:hypothetical protein
LHRLGDDKTEIVCQAVRKPLAPVGGGVGMTECGFHPNVSIAYLDGANRCVVCPQVEGAATFEIEAGVVPMTGQDSVLEAAALEREAHVGATIVESETMATAHDEPALRLQLLKAPREREFRVRRVHEHASFERCGWAPMATAQFWSCYGENALVSYG